MCNFRARWGELLLQQSFPACLAMMEGEACDVTGGSDPPSDDSSTPMNLPASKWEELLQCPICREPCQEPTTLTCQHTFCIECLVAHDSEAGRVDPLARPDRGSMFSDLPSLPSLSQPTETLTERVRRHNNNSDDDGVAPSQEQAGTQAFQVVTCPACRKRVFCTLVPNFMVRSILENLYPSRLQKEKDRRDQERKSLQAAKEANVMAWNLLHPSMHSGTVYGDPGGPEEISELQPVRTRGGTYVRRVVDTVNAVPNFYETPIGGLPRLTPREKATRVASSCVLVLGSFALLTLANERPNLLALELTGGLFGCLPFMLWIQLGPLFRRRN